MGCGGSKVKKQTEEQPNLEEPKQSLRDSNSPSSSFSTPVAEDESVTSSNSPPNLSRQASAKMSTKEREDAIAAEKKAKLDKIEADKLAAIEADKQKIEDAKNERRDAAKKRMESRKSSKNLDTK